jgi:TrmH family RNA methyltransferase
MPNSLGAHHPSLQAARELLTKKGRDTQARFLIEGPTLLEEAIASGVIIESIFATERAFAQTPLLRSFDDGRLGLIGEASLGKLTAVEEPTGIIAVAEKRLPGLAKVLEHDNLLLLAGLNDPGNVGTLLRSAHAFGIRGVLMLEGSVELYNPKIVRAAMGALFRLDCTVLRVADAATTLADRCIVGAEMQGEALDQFRFPERSVLVIGHERHGLRATSFTAQKHIGIPLEAGTESLNAAVAGSIILYAWSLQRRA